MEFGTWTWRDIVRIVVVAIALIVLLLGLGITPRRLSRSAFNTPTPEATETPLPLPTSTPIPSATPTATSTFTPTPIPTSAFVADVPITFRNDFDNTDPVRGDWYFFPNTRVANGLLTIQGNENWDGAYGNSHLNDGQTVLIQFRYSPESEIYFAVETGEWQTPSYKSWGAGAEDDIFTPSITVGEQERGGYFNGDLLPGPDRWYVLMLHIGGEEDNFAARLWDFEDPASFIETQQAMGDEWAGLTWNPVMGAGPDSTIQVERYEELDSGLPLSEIVTQ